MRDFLAKFQWKAPSLKDFLTNWNQIGLISDLSSEKSLWFSAPQLIFHFFNSWIKVLNSGLIKCFKYSNHLNWITKYYQIFVTHTSRSQKSNLNISMFNQCGRWLTISDNKQKVNAATSSIIMNDDDEKTYFNSYCKWRAL